ncbi:hypothetical protein GEMRC1_007001 [Eukaryota sp. GEM-RC1]
MIPLQTVRGHKNCLLCTVVKGRDLRARDELSTLVSKVLDTLSSPCTDSSQSISSLLEQELVLIRSNKGQSGQIGKPIDLGVTCLMAFCVPDAYNVTTLSRTILEEALLGKMSARYLQRIVPITFVCHSSDLNSQFAPWVTDKINSIKEKKGSTLVSYRVEYKARLSSKVTRADVMAVVDSCVIPGFFVDLSGPDYTFVVEIIKNVLFCAVLEDFDRFKRYNLQSLMSQNIS